MKGDLCKAGKQGISLVVMYSYQKEGLIARFRRYLRYQSRFGYERLYLSASAIAILLTGGAIWWMFATR